MNRVRTIYLLVVTVGLLVGSVWYFLYNRNPPEPVLETSEATCSSCDARHKAITRSRNTDNLSAVPDK